MPGEFTNKLIEMHQRVVIDLQMHINVLTEQGHRLEHIIEQAAILLESVPELDYTSTSIDETIAWTDRRVALLKRIEQEVS